jgi:hypothetical protein
MRDSSNAKAAYARIISTDMTLLQPYRKPMVMGEKIRTVELVKESLIDFHKHFS